MWHGGICHGGTNALRRGRKRTSSVQVMACQLFSARSLPVQTRIYFQWHLYEQTSMSLSDNWKVFIQESTFENVVCTLLTTLFRPNLSIYKTTGKAWMHSALRLPMPWCSAPSNQYPHCIGPHCIGPVIELIHFQYSSPAISDPFPIF